MRYSKILLAIVLISILVFGFTMSSFAVEQTYLLTVFVNENSIGMGTVSGTDTYGYTEDVDVVATPNTGYRFVKWMVCFNGAGMNNLDKPAAFTCNLSAVSDYVPKVYLQAFFEPIPLNASVIVHYINDDTNVRIIPEVLLTGTIGDPYMTESKVFEGFELISTPSNASGIFGIIQGHVDYFYRVAETTEPTTGTSTEPTTGTSTEPTTGTSTEPTTASTTAATTAAATVDNDDDDVVFLVGTTAPATTEVITTEAIPLGAPDILNFDEIYEETVTNFDEFVEDEPLEGTDGMVDGEEILDDEVPLADGLPQTGQVSADMFYGIGGLISGLGLWLKRKK